VLQRFSQALMNQISQSILCTNLHRIDRRLARWLLMTHDRAGTDEFELAGILQKAALIRYSRGTLTVVDRNRLEASSCECYAVVKKESERLLQA